MLYTFTNPIPPRFVIFAMWNTPSVRNGQGHYLDNHQHRHVLLVPTHHYPALELTMPPPYHTSKPRIQTIRTIIAIVKTFSPFHKQENFSMRTFLYHFSGSNQTGWLRGRAKGGEIAVDHLICHYCSSHAMLRCVACHHELDSAPRCFNHDGYHGRHCHRHTFIPQMSPAAKTLSKHGSIHATAAHLTAYPITKPPHFLLYILPICPSHP